MTKRQVVAFIIGLASVPPIIELNRYVFNRSFPVYRQYVTMRVIQVIDQAAMHRDTDRMLNQNNPWYGLKPYEWYPEMEIPR